MRAGGTIRPQRVTHVIYSRRADHEVLVIKDGETNPVTDLAGEVLIEHNRPDPGIS